MAIIFDDIGGIHGKSVAIDRVIAPNVINVGDTLFAFTAGDTAVTAPRYYVSAADVTGTALTADATATNSGNVVTQIWRLSSPLASEAGAHVTSPIATIAHAMALAKVSGLTLTPKDGSSVGSGSGTSPSSGATGTLAQADEICIAVVGTEGPLSDAAGTWSNSFNDDQRQGTDAGGPASNITVSSGYLVVAATTAQTGAKTSIGSRDWAAAIVTYKGLGDHPFPPFYRPHPAIIPLLAH